MNMKMKLYSPNRNIDDSWLGTDRYDVTHMYILNRHNTLI